MKRWIVIVVWPPTRWIVVVVWPPTRWIVWRFKNDLFELVVSQLTESIIFLVDDWTIHQYSRMCFHELRDFFLFIFWFFLSSSYSANCSCVKFIARKMSHFAQSSLRPSSSSITPYVPMICLLMINTLPVLFRPIIHQNRQNFNLKIIFNI